MVGYEPLQRTFSADPPQDGSVSLINILVRQIEINSQSRKDVLDACEFVLNRFKEEQDV